MADLSHSTDDLQKRMEKHLERIAATGEREAATTAELKDSLTAAVQTASNEIQDLLREQFRYLIGTVVVTAILLGGLLTLTLSGGEGGSSAAKAPAQAGAPAGMQSGGQMGGGQMGGGQMGGGQMGGGG